MSETVPCACCDGGGQVEGIAYLGGGVFYKGCPRCAGSGTEPNQPACHVGLLLRNRRSGRVWAVYGRYGDGVWGVHRMIPSRAGHRRYVWQIILRPEHEMLDERRWSRAGFGDAWDHERMESDPLPVAGAAASRQAR
jgi:hypothetical protein